MNSPGEVFSAKIVELDEDAMVLLTGELDMATAPKLAEVLRGIIAQGPPQVVLDLSGLSFIDSSGIAALVDAQHRLGEQERRLSLRHAQRGAVRVFKIAGLLEFLDVQTDHVEDSPL